MTYTVGVDTGGTFTDCVVIGEDGHIFTTKAPSTPKDFSQGVLNAAEKAAKILDLDLSQFLNQVNIFGHGTTVATNTLITRTGSKTGFITTRGHEDTLLIGRIHQKVAGLSESEITDIAGLDKAVPIIPRSLIKGVTERVDYRGDVLVKLDEEDVKKAAAELAAQGVQAIGINLLWSFMNPGHERRIKELINRLYPKLFVSISSELAPVIKEYERGATTALNAYLGMRTSTYLDALDRKLTQNGLKNPLMIMQSMGGFMSAREACVKPVTTLASGPVGGAIASKILAAAAGYDNVITSDVGGTSFDVGLVIKGETEFSTPVFDKYRISIPMVDITSIGAGGGSIAWIEEGSNILKVGPQSAGADPGPVCYNLGGVNPTVTDADFILGRYNPDYFLGGVMKVDIARSLQAIEEKVARPLKMDPYKAAMGIVDIVDSHMADLIRKMTVGRGYDPREFVLLAFGGGGPSHVGAYGPDVGVKTSIIPRLASVFSAFGIAASDIIYVKEISDPMNAPGDADKMNRIFEKLEAEISGEFKKEGVSLTSLEMLRSVDIRYKGQVHELRTPVPGGTLKPSDLPGVVSEFEARYEAKYGKGTAYKAAGIEMITFRVIGVGKVSRSGLPKYRKATTSAARAKKAVRNVYFGEFGEFRPTDIYDLDKLKTGHTVPGPAIIEGIDQTVVVHPKQTARVDEYLSIVLK